MDGIRINKTGNGYTVNLRDPDIEKNNRVDKGPWTDPNVEFVFTDEAKMIKFVTKSLKALQTGDEYETAFSKALMEDAE